MNSTETISYFNYISTEIFECLSEIRYSVRLIEINENKGFIGFSIDTDYFCSQITVMLPGRIGFKEESCCSVQMYDCDDQELKTVLYMMISKSISDCMFMIIGEDVLENLKMPKVYLN